MSDVTARLLPRAMLEAARRDDCDEFSARQGAPLLLVIARDEGSDLVRHLLSAVSVSGVNAQPMRALHYETEIHTGDLSGSASATQLDASELRALLATETHVAAPIAKRAGDAAYMDRVSLGRARNKDIVLRDPSVSKFHAWFEVAEDGAVTIADAGSKNGTRVNGESLVARQPRQLALGDKLRFGTVQARLCEPELLWHALRSA